MRIAVVRRIHHRGRRRQRDERLVVGIDDPVERPEGGELLRLGASRPLEQLLALYPGDRRRQADANLHGSSFTVALRARWPGEP
jgi:hypothetical protein